MRLTDPCEDGEVRHDPEHEERDQPDVKGPGLHIGDECEPQPRDEPEVPESEPARPVEVRGSRRGLGT